MFLTSIVLFELSDLQSADTTASELVGNATAEPKTETKKDE
jgi:hypothetical protein